MANPSLSAQLKTVLICKTQLICIETEYITSFQLSFIKHPQIEQEPQEQFNADLL